MKKYDYGSAEENMKRYKSKTPPFYNLSNIETPVHLLVGNTDQLADVQDATRLYKSLTNSPKSTMKVYNLGHATFLIGNKESMQFMTDVFKIIG